MKTHINNRLYDTATAKVVLLINNADTYAPTDLRYHEVGIYKKKTGEYFLCHKTGVDGRITPISYNEAEGYVMTYGTKEDYIREFGVADSTPQALKITLPRDIRNKLDRLAVSKGQSRNQCIIDLIKAVNI